MIVFVWILSKGLSRWYCTQKWCTIYIDKISRLYKATLSNSFSVLVNLSSLFLFFSSSRNGFIMQLFFIFEVSILRFGVSFKCTRHSKPSSFLVVFQTIGLFFNLKTREYIRMHNSGSRAANNTSPHPFARNIATPNGPELIIWQLIQQRAQCFLNRIHSNTKKEDLPIGTTLI